MFFEALQSYYAPSATLLFFAVFIITDKLFSQRIKHLFMLECAMVALIIFATWTDRCLSAAWLNGWAWRLRTVTTFLNFAVSPCSPMILVQIYRVRSAHHSLAFFLPLLINFIFCISSILNGCIFQITPENLYHRGPLFSIPFVVSGFYMLSLVVFSYRQKTPSRRVETVFLSAVMATIALASLMEVFLTIRFMIWSTTEICVILYFLLLNIQKILYDPLTDTLSRVAYTKQLERISGKSPCVIAMLDVNGLKQINDTWGHSAGDEALCCVSSAVLRAKANRRSMALYRYGGDEFVMLEHGRNRAAMEAVLYAAQQDCSHVRGSVSFSYGLAVYEPGDDLHEVFLQADAAMYRCKEQMEAQQQQKNSFLSSGLPAHCGTSSGF